MALKGFWQFTKDAALFLTRERQDRQLELPVEIRFGRLTLEGSQVFAQGPLQKLRPSHSPHPDPPASLRVRRMVSGTPGHGTEIWGQHNSVSPFKRKAKAGPATLRKPDPSLWTSSFPPCPSTILTPGGAGEADILGKLDGV